MEAGTDFGACQDEAVEKLIPSRQNPPGASTRAQITRETAMSNRNKALTPFPRVAYLVGGLRISLGEESTTPGPRNHILNFVEALRREDCQVDLFVVSERRLLRRFAAIREGAAGRNAKWKTLLGDGIRLGAMVVSGVSTLIHSNSVPAPDVIYERLAVMQSLSSFHVKKRSALRIIESNGIMSRETAKDRGALIIEPVARRIEVHAYRRADAVVAVSDALADEIARFAGISREKIVVIPNAIPFSILDSEPAQFDGGGITIGFAGAVVEWQQLDLLIKAVSAVINSEKDLTLSVDIIGDGPALSDLKHLVDSLGVGKTVTFRGSMTPEQVQERMGTWTVGYAGHKRSTGRKMYHSPLKMYEYAGMGIGALSTPSDDATSLSSSGMPVWLFESEVELEGAIREIVTSTKELEDFRQDGYVKVQEAHSWNARLEMLFKAIA